MGEGTRFSAAEDLGAASLAGAFTARTDRVEDTVPVGRDPYLSVVVTARNDNHGGDLLFRMQAFVNALVAQCNRFALETELIFVEWNPPDDRPRLVEALNWPEDAGYASIRIIEVGEDLHRRFRYSDRLPLFQMIAKNVGIRRARGRFVLATNIDIIFSDALMRFLAARKLRSGRFYRVDRYDVTGVRDADAAISEQLRLCEQSLIRVCGRYGTLDLRTGEFYRVWLRYATLPWYLAIALQLFDSMRRKAVGRARAAGNRVRLLARALRMLQARVRYGVGHTIGRPRRRAGGSRRAMLQLMLRALVRPQKWPKASWILMRYLVDGIRRLPKSVRRLARRFDLRDAALAGARLVDHYAYLSRAALRTALHHLQRVVSPPVHLARRAGRRARHLRFGPPDIAGRTRAMARTWQLRWKALRDAALWARALPALHTNACGDFTLMSKDAWFQLRAYPELHAFSMFIDSIFVYQAHWQGFREEFLPFPIYHLEHGAGFRPDTEGLNELNQRLEKAGVPQIDNEQFRSYAIEMYRARGPLDFNDDDWGFAGITLPETVVCAPEALTAAGRLAG